MAREGSYQWRGTAWEVAAGMGEGGRFVCLGNPPPSDTVTSEFDLRSAFQAYFATADVPRISRISLGVDTFSSGEGGTAAAYIHRIDVLE